MKRHEGNSAQRLEFRLLGGFEVRRGNRPIKEFESQKVWALLAYLLLRRESIHLRDYLAGLLWPEKDDETAKRNLRQALYNLRTTLHSEEGSAPPILTTHKSIQVNPASEYWLDVKVFEDAVGNGIARNESINPQHLVAAAHLYRGDLLAGFFVSDSPEFEQWLLYEQERLREMALQALRKLVDFYQARGAYQLGTQFAHRLIELDPLSEAAHRDLMRLYALSGRRDRALAQYAACRSVLDNELGVAPLAETTALYHAMLAEEWPGKTGLHGERPERPVIPLVGRENEIARLRRSWEATRAGRSQLMLVEGENGVGKTRLVESCIREFVASVPVVVLHGCCSDLPDPAGYQPVVEAIRSDFANPAGSVHRVLATLEPESLAGVASIVPEIRVVKPNLPASAVRFDSATNAVVFEATTRLFDALSCGEDQATRGLILFLEDIHWAGRTTLELLESLLRSRRQPGFWLVATYRPEELAPDHPLRRWQAYFRDRQCVEHLSLGRLSESALAQIADAVVGPEQAGELARSLSSCGGGLPLAVTELINDLYDEGVLVSHSSHQWILTAPVMSPPALTAESLEALILRRVSRLPTSARRLLTLAGVIGQQFDAEFLGEAAREQMAVVEASLEVLVERQFVRWFAQPSPPNSLPTMAGPTLNAGARKQLAFTHDRIRHAIYHNVAPLRRQVMHREVATALQELYADNTAPVCEVLAYHCTKAGLWHKAVTYLHQAGDKAWARRAHAAAMRYYDQALEILGRLVNDATNDEEKLGWLEQRDRVQAARHRCSAELSATERHRVDPTHLQEVPRP